VEDAGVLGVATDLLDGLGRLGHRIDCFFPGSQRELPVGLCNREELTFTWAGTRWQWDQWYSRHALSKFVTRLGSQAKAFIRLRSAVERRHAEDPFDLIYQFSNIETLGVPRTVGKSVPLVIHPETHVAGELRWFIAERKLGRRCQRWYQLVVVGVVFVLRAAVQRVSIQRATLVICISSVFRDHLVKDYRFRRNATEVIPNPVRLARFGDYRASIGSPPTILVLGRIALRKGIDQVIELSHVLRARGVDVQIRIVGSGSLWSDYRPLLRDIDPTNTTYVGSVPVDMIPSELCDADILIQASKYEPFGLTVAEALAAGMPVIATPEVGAIEGASRLSAIIAPVSDPEALADAVETMLERLRADAPGVRQAARADAERLFSPDVVCQRISDALEGLVASSQAGVCHNPQSGVTAGRMGSHHDGLNYAVSSDCHQGSKHPPA